MVRSDAEVEMMHAPFVQKPVIVHEGTVKLAHVRREVFALADFILKRIPAILPVGRTDKIRPNLNGTGVSGDPPPLRVEEADQDVRIVDCGDLGSPVGREHAPDVGLQISLEFRFELNH